MSTLANFIQTKKQVLNLLSCGAPYGPWL